MTDDRTPPHRAGKTLPRLTGTEGGVWAVLTQHSILFLFDLDRSTVQRTPAWNKPSTVANRVRNLRSITDIRINEAGRWRVVSNAEGSTRTYPEKSNFVIRIEQVTAPAASSGEDHEQAR